MTPSQHKAVGIIVDALLGDAFLGPDADQKDRDDAQDAAIVAVRKLTEAGLLLAVD